MCVRGLACVVGTIRRLQNHVARFDFLAKRGRDACPIDDLDQDGQVAIGEGGGDLVQVGLGQVIGGLAHDEVEIAGVMMIAMDAAAIGPDLGPRQITAQDALDGLQIARGQVK